MVYAVSFWKSDSDAKMYLECHHVTKKIIPYRSVRESLNIQEEKTVIGKIEVGFTTDIQSWYEQRLCSFVAVLLVPAC